MLLRNSFLRSILVFICFQLDAEQFVGPLVPIALVNAAGRSVDLAERRELGDRRRASARLPQAARLARRWPWALPACPDVEQDGAHVGVCRDFVQAPSALADAAETLMDWQT